ncbi:Multiple RNA-binding domain-containing protein 1 [Malassezia sp. CBS 17886]|nr:Multiple RNA-binding domain-containing protein 1 [Malassezia sp. CBS 17886]
MWHFAQKGAVTDVRLMKRADGTSRRFAFVGYRTEEEADAARAYFDRTYLDTSRISVARAKQIGDEELAQQRAARAPPASRLGGAPPAGAARGGDARHGGRAPRGADVGAPVRGKSSQRTATFDDFLAVMAPKRKRQSWQTNEDLDAAAADSPSGDGDGAPGARAAPRTAPPKKRTKKAAADAPAPPSDQAAADEGLTDLEYMRRRMRHSVHGEDAPAFEQTDSEAEEDGADDPADRPADDALQAEQARARAEREAAQRRDEENVDIALQTGRLFVRNLPFSAVAEELEAFFARYGEVQQVHIPLDPATKASKGLAFVTFTDPANALVAFRARDRAVFQGRLLHVLPAVSVKPKPEGAATLKQKRLEARRASAGKDFNWGMLYMNSDAVAASVSDRLGVSKADILNPDEGHTSAAVRLALAETRVVQETKQFLAEHGVDLDALAQSRERSDDTILVKNIPYGTTADEVRALFARFGDVGRVLLPPANTLAVVEMPVVGEARAAFRALAYKRFKDAVLYLEKGPAALLPAAGADRPQTVSGVAGKPAPASSRALLDSGDRSADPAAASATLYVKNLNFATTSARLADAFRGMDDFVFARVQEKPDAGRPDARRSMGYGFVGFRTMERADAARRAMDGALVDGHALAVSLARRGHDADDAAPRRAPSAKMLVKNVPFEATKKDIRALFSAHGQLKSVRLPRQIHGRTRGFAFVEFVSRREAEVAMAALRHTHLLGRHLVLEWSGDESTADVAALRDKTRRAFMTESERLAVTGQRSKIRMGTDQIADAVAAERARREAGESESD